MLYIFSCLWLFVAAWTRQELPRTSNSYPVCAINKIVAISNYNFQLTGGKSDLLAVYRMICTNASKCYN